MEITKENLLQIKINTLDLSEWTSEDILEFIDYLKSEFLEYFSDKYTNIGIYKLTSPSLKNYIGQSININNRHQSYKCKSCQDQPILYNAIIKYGWDNFNVEILENLVNYSEESKQLLNLLEFLYIKYYKSLGECYNLSFGGDSHGKHHPDTIAKLKLSKKCVKVDKYDLNGNFIKTYPSINEIIREHNNISRLNIFSCLNEQQKTCHGFIFLRHNKKLDLQSKQNSCLVKIKQYSKSGELIQIWESVSKAGAELGLSKSGISDCLNQRKKSCGGFYWIKFNEEFNIANYLKNTGKTNNKKIIQLTLDNELVKEWNSVKEASESLKICRAAISQCLIGKTKSSNNYKWIYKNGNVN